MTSEEYPMAGSDDDGKGQDGGAIVVSDGGGTSATVGATGESGSTAATLANSHPRARAALTTEGVARVAELLRANNRLTVMAACIDAGVSHGAVKSALKAWRDGKGAEHIAPIARAVEAQCEELLLEGDNAFSEGRNTNWAQWRLETKHPTAYGRKQAVEHTGKDGEEIKVGNAITVESAAKMARRMLFGDKD